VSKASKRHCAGTVQSQRGGVGNVKQVGFEPNRKTAAEGVEVTRSGRLFQTRAVATGKASSHQLLMQPITPVINKQEKWRCWNYNEWLWWYWRRVLMSAVVIRQAMVLTELW